MISNKLNNITSSETPLWKLPGYHSIAEPQLAFHSERLDDCHWHPLRGLIEFGPYGRSLLYQVQDPIRVATIIPHGFGPHLRRLMAELEQNHRPRERRKYLPDFPGFRSIFGSRVVLAAGDVQIEIGREFENEMTNSKLPYITLTDKLSRAVTALERARTDMAPKKWTRNSLK